VEEAEYPEKNEIIPLLEEIRAFRESNPEEYKRIKDMPNKGIEIINKNMACYLSNTINPTNSLHEFGGVPRRVIIYHSIGTMQINAFG
jgi:hypothetical protein